jgi:hypothetical protein
VDKAHRNNRIVHDIAKRGRATDPKHADHGVITAGSGASAGLTPQLSDRTPLSRGETLGITAKYLLFA